MSLGVCCVYECAVCQVLRQELCELSQVCNSIQTCTPTMFRLKRHDWRGRRLNLFLPNNGISDMFGDDDLRFRARLR